MVPGGCVHRQLYTLCIRPYAGDWRQNITKGRGPGWPPIDLSRRGQRNVSWYLEIQNKGNLLCIRLIITVRGGNLWRKFYKKFSESSTGLRRYCSCHAAPESRRKFKNLYYKTFCLSYCQRMLGLKRGIK